MWGELRCIAPPQGSHPSAPWSTPGFVTEDAVQQPLLDSAPLHTGGGGRGSRELTGELQLGLREREVPHCAGEGRGEEGHGEAGRGSGDGRGDPLGLPPATKRERRDTVVPATYGGRRERERDGAWRGWQGLGIRRRGVPWVYQCPPEWACGWDRVIRRAGQCRRC